MIVYVDVVIKVEIDISCVNARQLFNDALALKVTNGFQSSKNTIQTKKTTSMYAVKTIRIFTDNFVGNISYHGQAN